MFGRRKEPGVVLGQSYGTLLGIGSFFEGRLQGENNIRIDGHFKGGLSCSGRLAIGSSGEVEAEIGAGEVYVEGRVHGNVRAEWVKLDHQACLIGDITTHTLVMAEGAVFHGECRMAEEAAPEIPERAVVLLSPEDQV